MEEYSVRLETIINMVSKGLSVCDVGCDHGYVSIALVKRGISPRALAMDINKGPLMKAKQNIIDNNLEDKIEVRLSNGLVNYHMGDAKALVIAGMGGPLIGEILSYNWDYSYDFQEMILSPQSKIPEFREFLYENDFCIEDEEIVYEDGKYYFIMKVVRNEDKRGGLTEAELLIGPRILEKRQPLMKQYVEFLINTDQSILDGLQKIEKEEVTELIKQKIILLEHEMGVLRSILVQ